MEVAQVYIIRLQDYINGLCTGMPAWEIIVRTAATTILLIWMKCFLFKDESELNYNSTFIQYRSFSSSYNECINQILEVVVDGIYITFMQ